MGSKWTEPKKNKEPVKGLVDKAQQQESPLWQTLKGPQGIRTAQRLIERGDNLKDNTLQQVGSADTTTFCFSLDLCPSISRSWLFETFLKLISCVKSGQHLETLEQMMQQVGSPVWKPTWKRTCLARRFWDKLAGSYWI